MHPKIKVTIKNDCATNKFSEPISHINNEFISNCYSKPIFTGIVTTNDSFHLHRYKFVVYNSMMYETLSVLLLEIDLKQELNTTTNIGISDKFQK